jgi:hypothetical protein
MKNPIFMAAIIILGGCESTHTVPPGPSGRAVQTINIELSKKFFRRQCVSKVRNHTPTCNLNRRKNLTCAGPGDTITWKWKRTSEQKFKITAKPGFISPFVAKGSCTNASNEVTCEIDPATSPYTFFDYNVEVGDESEQIQGCSLDPRFLIYRR